MVKAVATGYSKVLTRLCNKAGISAHMTIGSWKYSGSYTLVNVDFEGKQVYIDASGCKKDDLWNQRYISDNFNGKKYDYIQICLMMKNNIVNIKITVMESGL